MTKKIVQIVPIDPLRRSYRDVLARTVNVATDRVCSVTGELRVYRYIDIRWALRAAMDRKVRIETCASSEKVSPDLVNAALADGIKLHLLREDPREKFIVIDGIHYLVAAPADSKDEAARLYLNDPDGAASYEKKFREYMANSEPARMLDLPGELYAIP